MSCDTFNKIWFIVVLLFIGHSSSAVMDTTEVKCATCGREASVAMLNEDELKQLRFETTKQMILDRLDMNERPKFKNKTGSGGGVVWTPLEEAVDTSRQIIIFPSRILPVRRSASSVLKFHVTDEMMDVALQSAVLWTASVDNTSQVSWEPSDVSSVVNAQIERVNRSNGLTTKPFLSLPVADRWLRFNESRPYLVIELDSLHQRSKADKRIATTPRKKRSTSPICGAQVTECCRESLYISFKDLGWDDWIVAPEGFHAFYCRGSCRTATAPLNSVSRHASILMKMLSQNRIPASIRPNVVPCCAPSRLSSLSIFYSDENDVIKQRILPNMIVESCGCSL